MSEKNIVVLSAKRTPMGNMQGVFSPLEAHQLGAGAIKAAVEAAGIKPTDPHDLFMGCVLPAGQGQAPARQAALGAGLDAGVPCTTINKVCGSGMRAIMFAHDGLLLGNGDFAIAGGMESMTNAPYLLKKARGGYRYGHDNLYDHMALDGLEDPYEKQAMGVFGEKCAAKYSFSRAQQDDFALASVERAKAALESGAFQAEIAPVTVSGRKGDVEVTEDEAVQTARPEKIPQLKPAFQEDGTITAANASSISDGAAALVLARADTAQKAGHTPLARIVAHAGHAHAPEWFTTAPVAATRKVLQKAGWQVADVDLFEVNEAFAVVTMAAMQELNIPHEKININGGACALGHPIGASGARIVVTLIHALKARGLKKGVAAICLGGGEATAMAVEVI